jgi:transposase-like protein
MTNEPSGPIVPLPRESRRRTFSEADKRRIVDETMRRAAPPLSEVARPYGIAARLLFRWKQELTVAAPVFITARYPM